MFHLVWTICCTILLVLVMVRTPEQDNNEVQANSIIQNSATVQKSEIPAIDIVTWCFVTFYLLLSSFVFYTST